MLVNNILTLNERRGVDWKKLIQDILHHFRYSNNELARKAGVTPSTIGNILNNNVTTPRLSLLRKLEEGLSIKVNQENATFQIISTGAKEVKLPVIQEYNLRVLSMSYVKANAVREETIPYEKENNVFLVEVNTDSMVSTILPGDLVLVDLDEAPINNSTVFVLLKDGTRHLGKFTAEGDYIVVAFENSSYTPALIKRTRVESIGCIKKLVRNI